MGIGFVIILHLIALFILSSVIAGGTTLITLLASSKEKRKRNIWTAVVSPFIGIYTLYFSALFGSGIVSAIKDVDIGIGDAWYVPLPNNCQLLFIDIPELGNINKHGETMVSDIMEMQQTGNRILGKTSDNKYFSFNTATSELKEFRNEKELTLHNANTKPDLMSAIVFYSEKRNDIAGFALIIVGIISLSISIALIYLARKLICRIL